MFLDNSVDEKVLQIDKELKARGLNAERLKLWDTYDYILKILNTELPLKIGDIIMFVNGEKRFIQDRELLKSLLYEENIASHYEHLLQK